MRTHERGYVNGGLRMMNMNKAGDENRTCVRIDYN